MSTDFDIACVTCKRKRHLGQRFASGWAFGHGKNDESGRLIIGGFILNHAQHDVRVFEQQSPEAEALTREEDDL